MTFKISKGCREMRQTPFVGAEILLAALFCYVRCKITLLLFILNWFSMWPLIKFYFLFPGCNTYKLTAGSQIISQFIMDGSTLFTGSKLASRFQLENVFLKLLLLLFINLLIKRNTSLEIHLLATAMFHWEFAIATLSPTPSYSLIPTVNNVTSSLTSFQATIVYDSSRTLNASISASKALNELTSQTTSFQINMPVTKTNLAHLQGKIECSSI